MGRIDLELQIRWDNKRWRRKLELLQQGQGQGQGQEQEEAREQNGGNGDDQQTSNSNSNILNLSTSSRSPPEQGEDQGQCMMDLQLYRATIEGEPGKFIDTLVSLSRDKGLSVTAILNQVTPLGNTVLHLAAEFGHYKLTGYLACDFPHLIVTTNRRGDIPFIAAARSGNKYPAYLISRFAKDYPNCRSGLVGPEPDLMLRMTNKAGNTALHEALIAKHNQMVNCLLPTDVEVTFYYANKEGKTPFYIAIETVQINVLTKMLHLFQTSSGNSGTFKIVGKSPINAAIKTMNTDMFLMLFEKAPSLIDTRDEDGGTPLHCAASVGYYKGVEFLLNRFTKFILERDNHGLLPIHVASREGHVEIVKKLLREYPDTRELVTSSKGENILHIASKFGRIGIVKYVLETPHLEVLINQRDDNGNTPLHLATRNWFPKIVSCLTWKKDVELNLINDDGMTPLDIVEEFGIVSPSYRKRLTWIALKAAGGESNKNPKTLYHNKLNHIDSINQIIMKDGTPTPYTRVDYKDRVNTLLLVSTLVATVTFAAGFTMPGGYNNSTPDQGQATMLKQRAFQAFVICDAIAMYSAIIVAVTLIWAQLGDLHLVLSSLSLAMPLLGLSLSTMSTAFLAGVWLVVSELGWLSHLILIIGIGFLSILLLLFIPLFLPNSSKNYVMRYISYYFFFQLILIPSGSNDHEQ